MIVHSKGCILLSGNAALFLWPYLPKDCHDGKAGKKSSASFCKIIKMIFSFYQNDFLPSFSFWLFLYEVIFSSDTKTLCYRLKTNMTGSGTNVASKQKLQSAIY